MRRWRVRVVREFGSHQVDIRGIASWTRPGSRPEGFQHLYSELLALVRRASTHEQQGAPQDQRQRHYEEVVYAVREVMCFGGWVAGSGPTTAPSGYWPAACNGLKSNRPGRAVSSLVTLDLASFHSADKRRKASVVRD